MDNNNLIKKIYRHSNRYVEIIEVISSHGFSELITNSMITKYINLGRKLFFKDDMSKDENLTVYERIRMILEKLGPTFIKFGQIMSRRSDLIPIELIKELEKLQNEVPSFDTDKALRLLEEELGKPSVELFADFNKEPVAAASISQVHKAIMLDGATVAVKIQRPDIRKKIEIDIEIMKHLSGLIQKHIENMNSFNLPGIVEEFERSIYEELDFDNELTNIERFRRNFESDEKVKVPAVFKNLSTKKVLTMEFIDGFKVSETEAIKSVGFSLKEIAVTGVDSILHQVFEDGFFHADPHPGNIFVTKQGQLCFIDFGMMGSLSGTVRESFTDIISGIVNRDTGKVTRALLEITPSSPDTESKDLQLQVSALIDKHLYRDIADLDMAEVMNDLFSLFNGNGLRMPSNLFLLTRTIVLAQSLGKDLNPEFNIGSVIEKYSKKLMRKKYAPGKIAKEMREMSEDIWKLIKKMPKEIPELINLLKKGNFKVDLKHKGFENMLETHERISNKIAFSVVLASIIIGSSLIVLSGIPPLMFGIPIIGIVGYIGAIILAFGLIISIIRHGRL
ncbi:MAG: AarF/ABC1/UbiB kinase family protein [Candidatus Delongbacteria bacterium]|jgi:ubiquinone biosynthesis protein|nr:AarF/ABC1/UbiB kinase family protein [Candidatus Delongbacteria bacterium]